MAVNMVEDEVKVFSYIIVTDMEGNIRIYRLPKSLVPVDIILPESRERSVSRSVPWPKGSLSILILPSISVTIVFIALKTRIWHTQYNAQKFFKESRNRNLIGTAILYHDIDQHQSTHGFWTGQYLHPNHHVIVKVTWRVFNQLNVCFLFWYAITIDVKCVQFCKLKWSIFSTDRHVQNFL
jgi:hypothetical protein